MSRQRATAIAIRDDAVLLFRRVRDGHHYHSFPGGGVEEGETYEEALIREVREELTLDVTDYELLFRLENIPIPPRPDAPDVHTIDTQVYRVTLADGEPELGSPERDFANEHNQYHFDWLPLAELAELSDTYPLGIREKLIEHFAL